MNLITPTSQEMHEILNNAHAALEAGEITQEQYNEIVLSCFKAEAETLILNSCSCSIIAKSLQTDAEK